MSDLTDLHQSVILDHNKPPRNRDRLPAATRIATGDNCTVYLRLDATAASYHERLMMAFDIYLNKAAFEANEGIKFLTALTAVTLPAVLVGGWYGMNFDHMPELRSPHGYLWACCLTLISTALMVIYLKKKKWF